MAGVDIVVVVVVVVVVRAGEKNFWLDPILGQRTAYISVAPYARTSGFGP